MGDVELCIESQLAQPPGDARDALEHLLTHDLQGRLELAGGLLGRMPRLACAARPRPPRLGSHGCEMRCQLARRRSGTRAGKAGRQLAQLLEARVLLGGILGRQQRPAAGAQDVDEADDEDLGAERVEPCGGAPVQLHETTDPFARLGGDLRGLGRGGDPADEVELAPPGQLDDTREVDLAQLDGGPGEGAHDGRRVVRIDEQAHPGEHVAHLGPLQEGGVVGAGPGGRRRCWRDPRGGHLSSIRAHRATLFRWTRSTGASRSGSESGSPAPRPTGA